MDKHEIDSCRDAGRQSVSSEVDILMDNPEMQHSGSLISEESIQKMKNEDDLTKLNYYDKQGKVNNIGVENYSNQSTMKRNLNRPYSTLPNQPIKSGISSEPMRNRNAADGNDMVGEIQQNIYAYSSEGDSETEPDSRAFEGNEIQSGPSLDEDFYPLENKSATPETDNMRQLLDYLSTGFSGLYGIFIVVFGAVIPMAESFADPSFPFVFEAFYVYLYITSIVFLLYVHLFILRKHELRPRNIIRTMSRSFSFNKSANKEDTQILQRRLRSLNTDDQTGSFYLRLGAVVFGVGSMIHSGLHFGQYFQLYDGPTSCNQAVQAVKPFCHLLFSFMQLYLIFMNSKVCLHQSKTVARLGLMHMCGTNICVWFRCIVVETLSVIHQWNTKTPYSRNTSSPRQPNFTVSFQGSRALLSVGKVNITRHMNSLPELTCSWGKLMGKVVQNAGPYLYPCTIEYSLICAGVLYVMWSNVGGAKHALLVSTATTTNHDHESERNTATDEKTDKNKHRMSVDCSNSSKGLFCGLIISVGAIISMIAFYVMVNEDDYIETAVAMSHLSETIMYVIMTTACLFAGERMCRLTFNPKAVFGLEENLLVISFTGLVMFAVFSVIPVVYTTHSTDGALTIITNVSMILQASIQVVLLLATGRMFVLKKDEEKQKRGREFITFLILCNFSMWTLNTFETRKPEHNPLQMEFYGAVAWAIFTHVSVPLGIFFRFHSSVYLANIWKRAWKLKRNGDGVV